MSVTAFFLVVMQILGVETIGEGSFRTSKHRS